MEEETYTNNISDQQLAGMESLLRERVSKILELEKENEDIKTAIVDLMERHAV